MPRPAFLPPLPNIPLSHTPRMALPTGPHKVGVLDCRLPTSHAPSIRLRIYYPSPTSTTPAPWLPVHPTPTDQTTAMLSSFLSIPFAPLIRPLISPLSRQPLPASLAPPLAKGTFPPVLFSHGLGGSVGGYAHFCMDLASQGRVVLAPEHSDGSAFVSYVDGRRVPYVKYNPAVHGPSDKDMRTRQLETRLADCRRVMSCLGDGADFVPLDNGVTCPRFEVEMAELVIAGHSFGGATALLFAAEMGVSRVVCLDAWLQPLQQLPSLDLGDTRCLFVDMGNGMKASVEKREQLCRPSGKGFVDAVRINSGVHNNSSDFPMRLPRFVAVASGMTGRGSDPIDILKKQSHVVETFLGDGWAEFRRRLEGEVDGEVEAEVVLAPVGRARARSRVG